MVTVKMAVFLAMMPSTVCWTHCHQLVEDSIFLSNASKFSPGHMASQSRQL